MNTISKEVNFIRPGIIFYGADRNHFSATGTIKQSSILDCDCSLVGCIGVLCPTQQPRSYGDKISVKSLIRKTEVAKNRIYDPSSFINFP